MPLKSLTARGTATGGRDYAVPTLATAAIVPDRQRVMGHCFAVPSQSTKKLYHVIGIGFFKFLRPVKSRKKIVLKFREKCKTLSLSRKIDVESFVL